MRRLLVSLLVVVGLLSGGVFFVRPPSVPEEAIRSAVTRTPALMEQAFALPVAASFGPDLTWQSNASRCGPASVANVYRSMGEEETSEAAVLDGTGLCWTGWCIVGLTLDELAGVAQAHTERKVTVLRDLTEDQFLDHLRRQRPVAPHHHQFPAQGNLRGRRRASFTHRRLSRKGRSGAGAGRQRGVQAMAGGAQAAL